MIQHLYRKKFWSATANMTALTSRASISFWNNLWYGWLLIVGHILFFYLFR